ncbi:MAG: nicotinate phosphoribosyltransferase [Legionella sp. 40-6]|nr:MAG: nicotinate phosphoribosyltransferase [Legionella sp. 40-6]
MFNFIGSYTDQYQLTMAQVYFLQGHHQQRAVFDYFFRKLPFASGYAIFAGLDDLLSQLEHLRFSAEDLAFLEQQGMNPEFLHYLEQFRFNGSVYAVSEGELVFPNCPMVCVEASIIEAQLIETLLLNLLNFQTLIATKARRLREVAGNKTLVDFGMRRAQGPGSYFASRAAIIGGVDATSNVLAGRDFHIPISGTMAHSFVQSYHNELTAFREFAQIWPDNCTLLVDTYNTLNSGIPHAIVVGKELAERGHLLQAIRLDSGDLHYLAKEARRMLDDAGLPYVKIVASNQLDEHQIKRLQEQHTPIDVYGVGTNLVVGVPDAALDGVYKLAKLDDTPKLKLSETPNKITLPYKKQWHRLLTHTNEFAGMDVLSIDSEQEINLMHAPFDTEPALNIREFKKEPLLQQVMHKGKRLHPSRSLQEIAQYSAQRMNQLPTQYKNFEVSIPYQIGISSLLKKQRQQLIHELLGEH